MRKNHRLVEPFWRCAATCQWSDILPIPGRWLWASFGTATHRRARITFDSSSIARWHCRRASRCSDFKANAMYFELCALAYNVFALMRHFLPVEWVSCRATTVRWRLYAVTGKVVRHTRQWTMKVNSEHQKLSSAALHSISNFAQAPWNLYAGKLGSMMICAETSCRTCGRFCRLLKSLGLFEFRWSVMIHSKPYQNRYQINIFIELLIADIHLVFNI